MHFSIPVTDNYTINKAPKDPDFIQSFKAVSTVTKKVSLMFRKNYKLNIDTSVLESIKSQMHDDVTIFLAGNAAHFDMFRSPKTFEGR